MRRTPGFEPDPILCIDVIGIQARDPLACLQAHGFHVRQLMNIAHGGPDSLSARRYRRLMKACVSRNPLEMCFSTVLTEIPNSSAICREEKADRKRPRLKPSH